MVLSDISFRFLQRTGTKQIKRTNRGMIMIIQRTQAAIALLTKIYTGACTSCINKCALPTPKIYVLLKRLATTGLIWLINGKNPQSLSPYRPARVSAEISPRDILEVTGEH